MLIGPFKQIVTMDNLPLGGHIDDSSLTVIEEGGIVVENGLFSAIGKFDDLWIKGEQILEVPKDTVAIPGLIDCHTHICFAGSRAADYGSRLSGMSYQEIAARGGGILDTVKKTREATEEELVAQIVKRCDQLLKIGVTTCEVKSGYGLSVENELKMLEAIKKAGERVAIELVPTCLAAHTLPWEFKERQEYLDYIADELLPIVKERGLSSRVDIFVEKGAFWLEEAKEYLLKAKRLGFDLTVHADQFTSGGAKLAAEVGAVSADHLESSSVEDFQALQIGKVSPVVLPGASLGLGIPFSKAKLALDCNAPLAIASDWNPGSAPMGDLLTQAAVLGAYEKLTIAETLAAITYRAAHALRRRDCGKIAIGVKADLAIFDCGDYREILYHQGAIKPAKVFVKGEDNLHSC